MQMAFQAAQQQNNTAAPVSKPAAKPAADRAVHEDIFARTIQQHRQQ